MKIKALKSRQEFQEMKDDMSIEIDNLMINYEEFTKSVSPNHWRSTEFHFTNLKKLKDEIQRFGPLKPEDLEDEWIRDQVLTDEEKDFYKTINNYNL